MILTYLFIYIYVSELYQVKAQKILMIKQDICLLNGASYENLRKVNSLLLYGSSLDSTSNRAWAHYRIVGFKHYFS